MNTTEWIEYYTTHPKDFDSMIKLAEDTILEQAAEIARLTAFNESMQTDARKNTETINKQAALLCRARIALTFYREWCAGIYNTRYPFGDEVENEIRAMSGAK